MTEAVDEMVRSEMEKYRYSIDDLNKLYSNLRTIASDADDSLVVVHSIQHEKDWFDNPIETSGQFSGVVIARTRTEILVLTPDKAVEAADSIEVAFPDGTMMAGIVKQSDTIMGLSVVSVDAAQMDSEQFKKVEAIKLGNSYGVKQGDMVVAIGARQVLSTPAIMEIYPMWRAMSIRWTAAPGCSIPAPAETRRRGHFC